MGITNNISRRATEHGYSFTELRAITDNPLTRGQARAVEQVLIENNPQFSNKINSISPLNSWYDQAVEWGKAWLKERGLTGE